MSAMSEAIREYPELVRKYIGTVVPRRDNFYAAARHGLGAEVRWLDGASVRLSDLLTSQLLDEAVEGLVEAGIPADEAEHWLGVIRGRVERSMTGADWQVAWVGRHGRDFAALVDAYAERQVQDLPVYEWSLK